MKRFLCLTLSYLILLQGCAATRPYQMREIPRGACATNMTQAYLTYAKATARTGHPDELLNLGVLAYEAGDYPKAVECLTRAEEYTHQQNSLLEKGMLHYYRGLAQWAAGNDSSVRSEGAALRSHLPPQEYGFLRWCEEAFARAGVADSTSPTDSGQVIIICEAGLMSPVEGETGTVTLVNSDLQFANSDSGRRLLGGMLYDRWEIRAQPYEASVGYVKASLQKYRYVWQRMTCVESVEARYDSAGSVPLDMAVNVGATKYEELRNSNIELLAIVPLRIEEPMAEPIYAESPGNDVTYRDREDRNVDRSPTKREGRRDAPEPEQAKKKSEEKKKEKEKKKEEKKEESTSSGDDNGGGGGIIGAIFAAIFVAVIVGLVSAMVGTFKSHGQEENDEMPIQPSWEMLPVKIYTAVIPLAPGPHDLRAVIKDEVGNVARRHDFGTVNVQKGETVILRARFTD